MISVTWWTYRSIYSPEYFQYWFQNAVLNLITTRRELTLLQYSTTLSSIITSFCIIFDFCYMMNQQYYIYSRILQVLFQHAALNLIYYSILIHSQAESHHSVSYLISATWWTHLSIYIPEYSQYWFQNAALNLITTIREFALLQYSTTLKLNHIILYHISFLLHDEPTVLYIFQNTPSIDLNML